MDRIPRLVGKYMAVIILVMSAITLFHPGVASWMELTWVNYYLMVAMFGMGLTIKFSDFKAVFTHPRDILIGCIAQFAIMPFLAYVLGMAFGLEVGLLTGMILVGCCPGGTSSNVITYLSKGDVPLSIGMTSVNTLLAPLVTPALVYLYLSQSVDVDMWSMFQSIIEVVIIPIAAGFVINYFFSDKVEKASPILPVVSVAAITLVVIDAVAHNSDGILNAALALFAAVVLHNLLGYLGGFAVARALHMSWEKQKALTVEVGMQNSGMATSLAHTSFALYPMATIPGALFTVWHNISGALLATAFSRYDERKNGNTGP